MVIIIKYILVVEKSNEVDIQREYMKDMEMDCHSTGSELLIGIRQDGGHWKLGLNMAGGFSGGWWLYEEDTRVGRTDEAHVSCYCECCHFFALSWCGAYWLLLMVRGHDECEGVVVAIFLCMICCYDELSVSYLRCVHIMS